MLRRLIAVCSALIATFFLLGEADAEAIDVAKYANLAVGHQWNYQQSLYPYPWRVEVDSITVRYGYELFLEQEYDAHGFKNDLSFIKTDLSSGMYIVDGRNDYGQPTEQSLYWIPPVPRLYASFVPGQVYPLSGTHMGLAYEGSLSLVKEPVTVPAGTFSDIWKVTLRFISDPYDLTFKWWYAKGIGLAKSEQEDGNVWELTGYSGFAAPVPELPTDLNGDGKIDFVWRHKTTGGWLAGTWMGWILSLRWGLPRLTRSGNSRGLRTSMGMGNPTF